MMRLARNLMLPSLCLIALAGCLRHEKRFPLSPLPLADAAAIVNANIERIPGTMRAVGSVDVQMVDPDGRTHTYHTDGVLFFLAPTHLRFDLKVFGERQFFLGCNSSAYWVYTKQEGRYDCGRHDDSNGLDRNMLVHPKDLMDAIGMTLIPIPRKGSAWVETSDDPFGGRVSACVQRVVDEYQQILFLVRDPLRSAMLEKEYWLDRYEPRLVRRVVFRDLDGVVTLSSALDDYRSVSGTTALLPHVMTIRWPQSKGEMRFQVRKWSLHTEIGPEGIQFRIPQQCLLGPG